jgi:hypothetical protein
MVTAVIGYGIVFGAVVLFVCRLELRQRQLQARQDALGKAMAQLDRGSTAGRFSRAA